jgi:hypothetical protein
MKRSIKLKRARSSCPVDSENSSSIAHIYSGVRATGGDIKEFSGLKTIKNMRCFVPYHILV